jgi:flagellar motor component MotA
MMHSYVTVAALCRPMSEALRLRTAKDMSSLEMLIASLVAIPNAHLCPVVQEFK